MQDAYTVELPITKAVITLKGYLTTGQSRDLQRILLAVGVFDEDGVNMKKISPETALDMQDKAAELLVTEVKMADGSMIPFTKEWLYDLPIQDGNLVYEYINKIIGEVNLSAEDKKK